MLTHFNMLLSLAAKHKSEAGDLWKAVFITESFSQSHRYNPLAFTALSQCNWEACWHLFEWLCGLVRHISIIINIIDAVPEVRPERHRGSLC